MMNNRIPSLFLLALTTLAFQACNPDCETVSARTITIESGPVLEDRESQILLRSSPATFLQDRTIFIDDPVSGPPNKISLDATFEEMLGGVVVTLPQNATRAGDPGVYVEDPDCSGDFIFVNPLQIRTKEFFLTNDLLVIPPMPLIMIPTPAITPPASITNAWITPYERSYCIWFVPELDNKGNELNELRVYQPGEDEMRRARDPDFLLGSHEFVVCDESQRHNINADKNPVSGYVDKAKGVIRISIDRTAKGLPVENFTGTFINPDTQINLPEEWRLGGACQVGGSERTEFMLLTSETTGQQLLMIKAG